jgi:hypothetical protein
MFLFKSRVVCRSLLSLGILLAFSAIASAQDPVGEWNLQSDAQGQITNFTLTITKAGEALKGKVVSEQYGNEDLADLKFDKGTLTYTRNLLVGGEVIPLAFKGKIEGDKLTGAYSVQGLEIPVTGSRKKPAVPASPATGATPNR